MTQKSLLYRAVSFARHYSIIGCQKSMSWNIDKFFVVRNLSKWVLHHTIMMTSSSETFSALLALCEGIHRSQMDSPTKPVTRSFDDFLISVATNSRANNCDAGDLRQYRAHYDVTVIARLFNSDGRKAERWHQLLCDPVPKLMYIFEHHDGIIKWTNVPRHWPFVRGIHRSPVNFPHKGQLRGALMLSLICAWINGYVNSREAGDLRRYRAHYDVTVMRLHKP